MQEGNFGAKTLDRQNAHRLMLGSLGHRNPHAHLLRSGGNILHGEVVGEAKGAGWGVEFLGIRSNLGGQLARRKKEKLSGLRRKAL